MIRYFSRIFSRTFRRSLELAEVKISNKHAGTDVAQTRASSLAFCSTRPAGAHTPTANPRETKVSSGSRAFRFWPVGFGLVVSPDTSRNPLTVCDALSFQTPSPADKRPVCLDEH